MKSMAQILKYEGLLLTGITLAVLFFATDMFMRFWYLLLLGPVCMAVGFVMDLGSVGATMRKRTAKYGVNAVVFTIVVAAIIVFVNVIAQGYDKKWDGTTAGVNTLSEQTVKILQSLKAPVKVTAFFPAGEAKAVRGLLDRYEGVAAKDQFSDEIVDPDQHPELLKKYEVSRRGAIVVEQGERKNIIAEPTEQALTQSILKVTQAKAGPVCFVTGHGEPGLEDQEDKGAGLFKRLLENENHDAKEAVLAGRAVPEDCGTLVIAGTDRPLSDVEVKTVQAWVEKGGDLMLLDGATVVTGLEPWLAELGVTMDNNVIVEPFNNPFFGSQLGVTPVVQDYPPTEITKDLHQPTVFNMARSMTISEGVNNKAYISPLLKTSADAWGEMDIKDLLEKQIVEKGPADKAGPLVLGAVIDLKPTADAPPKEGETDKKPDETKPPKTGRIVLFGDSSFIRNSMISQLYNNNLALNTVAWLSGKEEMISIRPNQFPSSMVYLDNEDRAKVFVVSAVAVPMLISMFGIGVIISRNRRSNA